MVLFTGASQISRAADEFRSGRVVDEGNTRTARYDSCVTDFEGVFLRLVMKAPAVATLAKVPLRGTFNNRDLQMELVPSVKIGEATLVHVPSQSFLLGQLMIPTAGVPSSPIGGHKSVDSLATLSGYYLILPADEPIRKFLQYRFAVITYSGRSENLARGDHFLIPVEHFPTMRAILEGKNEEAWKLPDLVPAKAPTDKAPIYAPAVAPRAGLIRTGRGTYYDFREDGSVRVYPRQGGAPLEYSGVQDNALPYASHAAILLRQGRIRPEDAKKPPHELARIALDQSAGEIAKFEREQKVAPTKRPIYRFEIEVALKKYETAAGRWPQSERDRAVMDAIDHSPAADEFLPPLLRWSAPNAPSLLTSPGGKDRPLRVMRHFVMLRFTGFPNYVIRIHDIKSLHLEPLFAYLGRFGLLLEEDKRVAGGLLAYNYDPTTFELLSIDLESNEMNSLSRPGTVVTLSTEEITFLADELKRTLPYRMQDKVPIRTTIPR